MTKSQEKRLLLILSNTRDPLCRSILGYWLRKKPESIEWRMLIEGECSSASLSEAGDWLYFHRVLKDAAPESRVPMHYSVKDADRERWKKESQNDKIQL